MKFQPTFILNFIVVNLLCTSVLAKEAQPSKVTIEVSAGLEQDSNVNIVELDQSSNQSDIAALLGVKVDKKWQANKKLSLSAGYALTAKKYQNYAEYDLVLHQLSADVNYAWEPLTLGASYHFADANVNKNNFLVLQQTSLYASKLINQKIYLRAAVNLQDKKFAAHNERNAKNIGFTGDAFLFFNDGKTFVALGVSNEDENAKLHELDYAAKTVKARLSHHYLLWNKQQKFHLGTRHLTRDYAGVNAEINQERYDSAQVSDAEWEINFTPMFAAAVKLEYSQYNSNLPSAQYSETRTSMTLKARF